MERVKSEVNSQIDGHRIYSKLPYELKLEIDKQTRRINWEKCISKIHTSREWKQSYIYRKYKYFYDSPDNGITTANVTATNRIRFEIADELRYQDFINGTTYVTDIIPLWRHFRIEPTINDIVKIPYITRTPVLAYAFMKYMQKLSQGASDKLPAYYARDMLEIIAVDLVDRQQLLTRSAKSNHRGS